MAKDDFIRINWDGLNDLDGLLEGIEEKVDAIAEEEYQKYGLFVEAATKSLVHHDEGDLEASIHSSTSNKDGQIETVVGSNMKYALRRHEEPYRMGTHNKYDNGAKFERYYLNGRGRRTLLKPKWRGYKPGRKYLDNAVKATAQEYDETNERILRRITGENI
ncbi:HK97 gp10 family phage protein [Domibacillus enclensis]|uniref:Phage protein, HK97 gp10 family n=1 Tax=Domibacillus enclensis TaxID=1017273 RepID=A0A1N6WJB9_9BACI|nr:HK97 gp10 family phage protein [Domibacillus enclensis]OXS77955.1 hypothetical protein B1B05_10135 [Domibacillus enclensis]SIQ90237.1 hypothetical protein SAMN05443094_104188 [Domibacillus enclensis]